MPIAPVRFKVKPITVCLIKICLLHLSTQYAQTSTTGPKVWAEREAFFKVSGCIQFFMNYILESSFQVEKSTRAQLTTKKICLVMA